MFRRYITYISLFFFCWAQSASALNGAKFTDDNEFLKDAGVTKRAVPLKELQEKYGSFLPEPIRIQMENLIKENPSLTVPKVDVSKIQVNGKQQLQFSFNIPSGSLVLTTVNSDKVAYTLVGSINGQTIKEDITYELILRAHEVIYEQRKELKKEKPIFLTAETIYNLSDKEKKAYIKKMRALLEATEAVQRSTQYKSTSAPKKSVFNYFFEKAIEGQSYADAAPSDNCIIAGNVDGIWDPNGTAVTDSGQKGVCKPPRPDQDATCSAPQSTTCNPLLYGDNACVPFATPADKSQATVNCGATADPYCKNVLARYKKDLGVNKALSVDQLNQFLKSMKDKVNQATGDCNTFPHTAGSNDQVATCKALKERVADINSLDCNREVIKNDPSFSDACALILQPPPTPPGPVNPAPENPLCTTSKVAPGSTCTVAHATSATFHCKEGDRTYCNGCEDGYVATRDGDIAVVSCDKQVTHEPRSSRSSSSSGGIGSWFSKNAGWLLLGAGILGIGGLIWYKTYTDNKNEQALLNYYAQINSSSAIGNTLPNTTLIQPLPGVSRQASPGVR